MENYYKILEVDTDASEETIEKVYKILVKKYHPDLKTGDEKKEAENKIKKINEAYSVLSDKFKRAEYDQLLNNNYIPVEKYNLIVEENNKLKQEINYLKNKTNYSQNNYNYQAKNYASFSNEAKTNVYQTPKPQTPHEPKETPKEKNNFLITIISVLLTILIIIVFLQIPFIKKIFVNFNFENIFFLIIIVIAFYYFFFNKNNKK